MMGLLDDGPRLRVQFGGVVRLVFEQANFRQRGQRPVIAGPGGEVGAAKQFDLARQNGGLRGVAQPERGNRPR